MQTYLIAVVFLNHTQQQYQWQAAVTAIHDSCPARLAAYLMSATSQGGSITRWLPLPVQLPA